MKIAAIDIGSNSVRLALFAGGKALYKRLSTTRLGEGLATCGYLAHTAIERTANAVAEFYSKAKEDGADKVYAFATAAARSAKNGGEFTSAVKNLCGLSVDVIDGETEAKCGILGALRGGDGGIIDVGGASTEVIFSRGGNTPYAKSVDIGTVRLNDSAGRDKVKLQAIIDEKVAEYPPFNAYPLKISAIGGTATRLAAIKCRLLEYHPEITDGVRLSVDETMKLADKLLTMPVDEIRRTTICKGSADVVGGGALLLCAVMKKFDLEFVEVSESDNLEGYVILREGKL